MRAPIKWAGIVCLCAAIAGMYLSRRVPPPRISPNKYQQVLDEVMSVDFPFRSLTPDALGNRLAYIHEAEQGRGLFLLDLKTLERRAIETTNEVIQIYGWSPDNRYLAFTQTPPELPEVRVFFGNTYQKEEWLTLLDTRDFSIKRVTRNKNVLESRFYWLGTNQYLFVSRPLKASFAEVFRGDIEAANPERLFNYRRFLDSLILVSQTTAAFPEEGNICVVDMQGWQAAPAGSTNLPSFTAERISEFDDKGFTKLRWLRYSEETGKYLFCATPADSNWRYLYDYEPKSKRLTQLTTEDTYNGQWLQQASGHVYVGNTNNCFFLAVRPKDAAARTNLFLDGGVVSYIVGGTGEHIYIVAAQSVEPPGIWEYDVRQKHLHLLVDAINQKFVASHVIKPKEFRAESVDGLQIPCFLYRPLQSIKGTSEREPLAWLRPRVKFPAVIFLPPVTAASKRNFDARVQLLANLGFYVVAVNYRGCEGYGKEYASLGNSALAAEDVLMVYRDLTKKYDIDKRNVFLSSSSDGSVVAYELLARDPGLWRAAALENPTSVTGSRFNASELPPLFFAMGDQDRAFTSWQKFQSWATTNRVEVQSVIYTNSGHITYKTSQRKDKLDQVARFLLSNMQ